MDDIDAQKVDNETTEASIYHWQHLGQKVWSYFFLSRLDFRIPATTSFPFAFRSFEENSDKDGQRMHFKI